MSLLSNNKKNGKKDKKQLPGSISGPNNFMKTKAAAPAKKTLRTGGTRGS